MLATNSDLTYKWQSRTVYSAPARLLTNNVGEYAMATKHFRCDYSQFQSEPFESAVCIPLTKGKHALIDVDDYDKISQSLWSAKWIERRGTGYARCHIGSMHRIIMNTPKGLDVDHQNGNGLDNRKANLRNCTRAQNCWNVPRRKANKSPYRGVDPYYSRWQTSIYINNKKHYLGTFDTAIEAARAYDKAAIEMRGDFALLNLPATVDEIVGE